MLQPAVGSEPAVAAPHKRQARSPARVHRGAPSQAVDEPADEPAVAGSGVPPQAGDLESGTSSVTLVQQESDERQCRICFGGEEAEDELGPLFRPCSCRGTMAWVHMECLDRWRHSSSNPQSEFRCEQCKFEYRFGRVAVAYAGSVDRFTLARFLTTPFAVHILSLAALFATIFALGFVGKAFSAETTWWEVICCFNLKHLLAGSIVTGIGSLIGSAVAFFGNFAPGTRVAFDTFGRGHGIRGGGGGGGDDKIGMILLAIAVVIGLCIAFSWIYQRVEAYARRTARHAQQVVLDAHHLQQPAHGHAHDDAANAETGREQQLGERKDE